jgi:hypothetical protein
MCILPSEKLSRSATIRHSTSTLQFSNLSHPDTAFEMALSSSLPIGKVAYTICTALNISGIDYFTTSDTKVFKKTLAPLPVITPKSFIQFGGPQKSNSSLVIPDSKQLLIAHQLLSIYFNQCSLRHPVGKVDAV